MVLEQLGKSGLIKCALEPVQELTKKCICHFFDFENDIICAKLAEKLQTAYEGLKKKSEVTLVEPEQPKTPKGNEQAAKTGDNMIIGT